MKRAAGFLLALAVASPGSSATPATAAAPEIDYAGTTLRQADLRVGAIAYRLAKAGSALCANRAPLTGLLFHHLGEYRAADRPTMIARYTLDRGPGILAVVSGSPAAEAGLAAGDVLLSVNGQPFPAPELPTESDKKRWRLSADKAEDQLDLALRQGPAHLRLVRDGRELGLVMTAPLGCFGRVRLARSNQVNAFSTGHSVVMTTAMLDFVRSDDELAVVLGHELAHQILGHPVMRNEEGVLASFGIGAAELWHREAEADRLGLRLMAAAGFDLGAAIPFWRRYLGKYDWYPQIFRSHPSLKAREKIVREEVEAIRRGSPRS
jgi:hypothetical protein